MQVECEELVAIRFGPIVPLIDHETDMRMAAPSFAGLVRHPFLVGIPLFMVSQCTWSAVCSIN